MTDPFDFFGQPLDLRRWAKLNRRAASSRSANALFEANSKQLKPIAGPLGKIARQLRLDDYGIFRLHCFAIDQLAGAPTPGAATADLGTSIHANKQISRNGRMLAIAALARLNGWAMVPVLHDGAILIYVPVKDAQDSLNVHWRGTRWTRTVNGKVSSVHDFHWLVWDGETPLGLTESDQAAEAPLLEPDEIIDGPQAGFHFFERKFPGFTMRTKQLAKLELFDGSGTLDYQARPDASRYLDYYPQYHFGPQTTLARQELTAMAMGPKLTSLRDRRMPEPDRIDLLLRTIQDAFTYTEGPLRPLFHMFEDRQGDCDQLSLILAACLKFLGYDSENIIAMRWPTHLCLALSPQRTPPSSSQVSFAVGSRRFYPLDATYYYHVNGRLATRWGMLSDEHAKAPFELKQLPS